MNIFDQKLTEQAIIAEPHLIAASPKLFVARFDLINPLQWIDPWVAFQARRRIPDQGPIVLIVTPGAILGGASALKAIAHERATSFGMAELTDDKLFSYSVFWDLLHSPPALPDELWGHLAIQERNSRAPYGYPAPAQSWSGREVMGDSSFTDPMITIPEEVIDLIASKI